MADDDPTAARFGQGTPFTVGAEEELFVVAADTGVLRNHGPDVVGSTPTPVRGSVATELHACQLELITDVCPTARDAATVLTTLRGTVAATGAGLLGSGTHPTAPYGYSEITQEERYARIHALLGDAVANPVSGLHVHVGMPDAATAVRVFNGLRRELPLLQALSANSPFRHERDSGLASARELTIAGWPRSGVPGALRDWDEFSERAELLCRAADVPDYTYLWWKLRPHPRLGTVEVRAMDVQTSVESTAALVALVQVLAREAAEIVPRGPEPAGEIISEATFRAARFGVEATLPDADARLRSVPELLSEVLRRTSGLARELDCTEELAVLPAIVAAGGGAGWQREVARRDGIKGLRRALSRATTQAPT